MEYHRLRFALFGNTYQGSKSASIQQMIASIRRYDAELYVDKEYYDFLKPCLFATNSRQWHHSCRET